MLVKGGMGRDGGGGKGGDLGGGNLRSSFAGWLSRSQSWFAAGTARSRSSSTARGSNLQKKM